MRRWLLGLLLLVPLMAGGDVVYKRGPGTGLTPNIPTDTDGDGRPDYVIVGDYDGDGSLETSDIQAAHDAVTVSSGLLTLETKDTANCDGADDCIDRSTGTWEADGFKTGDLIKLSGFPNGNTGRLSVSVDGTSEDYDRAAGDYDADGFIVGAPLYAYGFNELPNSANPSNVNTISVVGTLALTVSDNLVTEIERHGTWLLSPGINGMVWTVTGFNTDGTEMYVDENIEVYAGAANRKAQTRDKATIDVLPGTFATAAEPAGASAGIVELDSFVTLNCNPGTVIRGIAGAVAAQELPVIGFRKADEFSFTEEVTIDGCHVDGGDTADTSWVFGGTEAPMGYGLRGSTNVTVRDPVIRNTIHSCFYANNSLSMTVTGLDGDKCGDVERRATVNGQPGIYIFATPVGGGADQLTADVTIKDSVLRETGATAYNFRKSGIADDILNTSLFDSTANSNDSACANFRGTRGTVVDGLMCLGTLGIQLCDTTTCTSYQDADVTYDLTLRNVDIRDSSGSSSAPSFLIGPYLDTVTMENIVVSGGPDNTTCINVAQPNRLVTINGLLVENCGSDGIDWVGADAALFTMDEAFVIRNLTIRNVPADGINSGNRFALQFARDVRNLTIDGFEIVGSSNPSILINDHMRDSVFRNGTINPMPARNWGYDTSANLPEDAECDWRRADWWVQVTDAANTADCDFNTGTGASTNTCVCDGDGTWTDSVLGITRIALDTGTSLTLDGLLFENILFLNSIGDDAMQFDSALTNSVFKNIHTRNPFTSASAAAHGALRLAAGSSGITIQNVTCGDGIEATEDCVVVDGWDDLTNQSVINQNGGAADPAGVACTTGSLFTRDTTGAGAVLHVCENSLWVAK